MIAGGVTLSVIVSPVVAAVTVGQSVLQPLYSFSVWLFIFFKNLISNMMCSSVWPHVCVFEPAGIGVPIMLAYVYGVVPISLCRSGGCGVSAGNGKGVRIEFDDENDMNVGSGAAATGKLPLHPALPNTNTQKPRLVCILLTDKLTKD